MLSPTRHPGISETFQDLSIPNNRNRRKIAAFSNGKVAISAAIYRSAPGPGPESAPRSAFRAILGTCLGVPQRVLFECFLKKGQKALKDHSLGRSEAGAQNCSKSTPWGTFRPGPRSTPVNGGRDRNGKVQSRKFAAEIPEKSPESRRIPFALKTRNSLIKEIKVGLLN